jgi:hypothetical protein
MIWNRHRLEHYLGTDEKAIIWCKENGFLHREMNCRRHRSSMKYVPSRGGFGVFRCRKGGDCFYVSAATGTWLEDVRIPLPFMFL